MKPDHDKTLAQEPRHQQDLSGDTLTEPCDPISKKEGQIANTPNLNSCDPHRSYQYIRSIKPKQCVNVNTRLGHRNGCLLCMFNVDHSGVSKPTHTQDVSPTVVELSTKDEPNAKAPLETKSSDTEDLAEQETPPVKDNVGDESSEKPPVIDLKSPVELPTVIKHPKPEEEPLEPQLIPREPEAEVLAKDEPDTEAPQDIKSPDIEAPQEVASPDIEDLVEQESPSVKNNAGEESLEKLPMINMQSPVESSEPEHSRTDDATKIQNEDAVSEDRIAVDGQANKVEKTPAPESKFQMSPSSNLHPTEHATPDSTNQTTSDDSRLIDDTSSTDEDDSSTEDEKKHTIPLEQKDVMTQEPPADDPVQTKEQKDESNAKVNDPNADEATAIAQEYSVPEEEGIGLGHVFPFLNPNYDPEPLENPSHSETCAMEQKDSVTPEPSADSPVQTEEQKDENDAETKMKKADEANVVAPESFVPEEEGTGLGHVFPFLNPDYAPEPLENPHGAGAAAKEGGESSKLNLATFPEMNNEDPSNEVLYEETNEGNPKDPSNNETSMMEVVQEDKHRHQSAPLDGEKNDKDAEVIPSNDEREQTEMDAPQAEEYAADENEVASEAQAPAEAEDFKDGPVESTSNSDTKSIPGEANMEVEKELDGNSSMPDGDLDAPIMKAVPEGSAPQHVPPFRTKPSIEGATAADTTADHTNPEEGNGTPKEEIANPEDARAKNDEDDPQHTEEIKEPDSVSSFDSPPAANHHPAPIKHDPQLEHTSSESSEKKQDQQCVPSTKTEDTQQPTEELRESPAIHPLGAVEEAPLIKTNEPETANKDAASESSSGGSAYESFDDEDDTSGEDNLISQAVSNLRHETLNDGLMDRLVEDPVRVGEIVAASTPTKEEEEPRGSEKLTSVPEDLARSDQDSIPELKLAEPVASTDKDETRNKPHPANEGDIQKFAADDHSQHEMVHNGLTYSLAEDPIGVGDLIPARSGEVDGLTVDLLAPSVQTVTNDDTVVTSAASDETEETIKSSKDIQGHQQPAPAMVLEIQDEHIAKLTESTSPPQETEAPIELDDTTPKVPTPTKSQQRRAQAKRAKERKAAERAAAASQDNQVATPASSAADTSDKNKFGKTNMTKRQIKRARQTRAKQRRMEAEKSSTQ